MQEIAIADIKIESRHRKQMGDIAALATSIEQIGLLQPIGVQPDHTLIFGHRRLLAFQHLGRTTIPATVINVPAIVLGEHAENEVRKDFTDSERVAIGLAVEAELGKRQGQRTDLAHDSQTGMFAELPVNLREVKSKETSEVAAKKAGYGSEKTYRDAKTVVQKGSPELIEAMDKGDIAISTAAKLADQPPEIQQQAVADPKAAIELAKKASAAKQSDIKQQASSICRREAQSEMETVRA
ncbi:MAG: ParB N-terminal domain-containing protein, partial [Candidatus Competibacter denitrificans]